MAPIFQNGTTISTLLQAFLVLPGSLFFQIHTIQNKAKRRSSIAD